MAKRTGNPKIATAYLRVSTSAQELGPEAQRAQIEAWAAREGVRVASWHVDAGVSGATPIEERPGLCAALASLRTDGAGVLVAAKRDRLGRKEGLASIIADMVRSSGAVLRTADGASDGEDDDEGAFVRRSVEDMVSVLERMKIRARTRAALAVKKARGERTGEIAYGFRLAADGVHVEEDPAEQGVIAVVRELRAAGLSQRAIVRVLATRGIVSRGGRPLGLSQVQRLLPRTAAG